MDEQIPAPGWLASCALVPDGSAGWAVQRESGDVHLPSLDTLPPGRLPSRCPANSLCFTPFHVT